MKGQASQVSFSEVSCINMSQRKVQSGVGANCAGAAVDITPSLKACFGCGKLDDPASGIRHKKCAGCLHAYYCGRSCQETHWPLHKVDCLLEKGLVDLDDKMSKTQTSRQSGMEGIPKASQFLWSEVGMEIPDHIQGTDDIIAYVSSMFSKGKQADVLSQRIAVYTKAYFSFLKNPEISHGHCDAVAE